MKEEEDLFKDVHQVRRTVYPYKNDRNEERDRYS